jgi:hypothetical protein
VELCERAREDLGDELRSPVDLDSHAVTHQIFAHRSSHTIRRDSPRFIAAQISCGQLDTPPPRRGKCWSACPSERWG